MATVKIILRTSKLNSTGEAPLCLRIIKNRRAKFVFLNYRISPEFWDDENKRVKKSHPNHQRLNSYIASKIADAQGVAVEMETAEKNILPEQIKDQIMGKAPVSFFKYADKYLAQLQLSQKIGTERKVKSILFKMKEYMSGKDLLFEHITVTWLKTYEQYLRSKKGNKTNTVSSNFRTLRVIINLAINEELITPDKNPFKRFKLSTEKVKKDYLTDDELMMIELAPLQRNSMKDHHRNMYVFSAYAGGLRISDMLLLKWKNFDGERIVVQTRKTSSTVSIKLPGRALDILKTYQRNDAQPEDFIFPILKNGVDYSDARFLFNEISSATAYTNDDLKEIAAIVKLEKRVSFHSARHTFATRALMKGVRIEYVSKLLGHANIATTQIYAKIVNEELDKAMEVFN